MEALQYIYTSWKNGDSTEKGYMIYSRSEGLSEAECSAIKDAMQYLAPKELIPNPTPQQIADDFPYAFAYFVLPTGRGCVAQSTYLGKDYSGRFGNYIIHALVFNIDDLPCRPAEFFGEPCIKTAMTPEELDAPSPVPPLPPLQITQYASVINDEQLNEFLYDKEEEFALVISMILAAQDAGVPFYLNDTRENLVLWSAAVQRILPPRLSRKFMFNTYIGDHESMRSPRAREEGLNFHLIGVRPDANYFNYATEYKSNRHMVLDFPGCHMTQGIVPGAYAQAMAVSMTFDREEIDAFGQFVDATDFDEINGHLQDAYLCYHLLKNDVFEFTEEHLKAVLWFGSTYCSEADNADIGSKLLIKCQEEGWTLTPDMLLQFWNYVCKYAGFMNFTLFDFFTETIYQHAGEAAEPCVGLTELLQTVKAETPQPYKEYLDYVDSAGTVEHLLLYLSGHSNPHTNSFYINWLLDSYSFTGGLTNGQPVSKLFLILLKNITGINGCEKQMIELLLATSDNQMLFENVLRVFMTALTEDRQLELLCARYVEVSAALTDRQLNRFEQLLLDTPGAAPLATRLCARKIAASKDPEEEFWRFYDNQRSRITASPDFALDPMILACIHHVDDRAREDAAIEILRKIDPASINSKEAILVLTNVINDCSVKTLAKMSPAFLQRVGQLRDKVDRTGLEKVKAVYIGELLRADNAKHNRPANLSEDLAKTGISLSAMDRTDYEAYVKNYFGEYFVLLQTAEDLSAFTKIFYNSRHFAGFVDDFVSAIKKLEKKESPRWKRILSWTCIYLVTAEKSERAAEELYKPVIRYMRSLDEDELMDVRQAILRDAPDARCEHLFDEIRRKEGLSEKLGNLFHKK